MKEINIEIRAKSRGYTVTLHSWQSEGGAEGIPAGSTKVDVTVIKSGATTLKETMAQRKAQMAAEDPSMTLLFEVEWSLAGGLPAICWQTESNCAGQMNHLTSIINGHVVILSGLGNLELVEMIAQTLRPINGG